MKNSIKIKSSVFLALLLTSTVLLLGFFILKGIKEDQLTRQESYLQEQSNIANAYVEQVILSDPSYKDDYDQVQSILRKNGSQIAMQLGTITGMHVVLYDMQGRMIGNSVSSIDPKEDKKLLLYALQNKIAYQTKGNTLYYVAPLNNGQNGLIQFEYSLQENTYFYNRIKNLFLQMGTFVVIISFLTAYFYFYRITNGILLLKDATEKIEQGNYRAIVPLKRSDELGKLSQGIYSMRNRIEENVKNMQTEQTKLNLAVDKLRKLEAQQKTFIGNITHEFKTPLSIILAYMDLLEMYKDDPALVEDARENVKKEAQRLYDMVEKVLHLASFERYDFELQQEKLESKEILEELCERMKGKAQKFDVSIITDLQPATLWIDKESMYLIFINLLDNAIKYNVSQGSIYLRSEVKKEKLSILIKDTGIGIPQKSLNKVFDPFYIVSKDRSKLTGGTGLGLALVKELVEKQQGTIAIGSTNEQGTEVLLTFPLYVE